METLLILISQQRPTGQVGKTWEEAPNCLFANIPYVEAFYNWKIPLLDKWGVNPAKPAAEIARQIACQHLQHDHKKYTKQNHTMAVLTRQSCQHHISKVKQACQHFAEQARW